MSQATVLAQGLTNPWVFLEDSLLSKDWQAFLVLNFFLMIYCLKDGKKPKDQCKKDWPDQSPRLLKDWKL